MASYKIISVLIVSVCVLVSAGIVVTGYQQMQNVTQAQKSVKTYQERMSNPVDALDPTDIASSYTNAQLIIPKLNVSATIRSDTVNAYNAVYHYPSSVMPGKPGECGILGHRTRYSGLFKNIASLKIGDQAIIKDYSQRKKYVYAVSSNGEDIRWDYKTNPIRFSQEGEPRLLIVTCYPPGKKEAAWITHFKLVSSSDL
ncbi:MAG: class E sortase [Methanobacteriaceae archaeon]|nr:class E sortase [Methanobacteriaceae archaeon]